MHTHKYKLKTEWQGNKGSGTSAVDAYLRTHKISIAGKPTLTLTTDDATYGDKSILNPEDLLVCSLSSCHMMSYLYLCAKAGVVVTAYTDEAEGTMAELPQGGGHFTEVILKPRVKVRDTSMIEKSISLHKLAHKICYIASSMNFPVNCEPLSELENGA